MQQKILHVLDVNEYELANRFYVALSAFGKAKSTYICMGRFFH